jgi:hypothetical protein
MKIVVRATGMINFLVFREIREAKAKNGIINREKNQINVIGPGGIRI